MMMLAGPQSPIEIQLSLHNSIIMYLVIVWIHHLVRQWTIESAFDVFQYVSHSSQQ
jgi:hypothetical protein